MQGRGQSQSLYAGNLGPDVLKSARLGHPGQHPFENYFYLLRKPKCRTLTDASLPPSQSAWGHLLDAPALGSALGGCSHLQLWMGMIRSVDSQRSPQLPDHSECPVRPAPGPQYYEHSTLNRWAPLAP